ncbi:hypothetical protein [Kitasatospora sp. NBC_00315]|uniref:hypothetical protein n=1 Tax=Kitasatospora sp. NBC_00315 TaxID=2975963 RepID=UPI00324488F1
MPGPAHRRPGAPRPAGRHGGGLVGGRYALTTALRQDPGGGLYLARDTVGGGEVVVRQARVRREAGRAGLAARGALRREAALLAHLDGHRVAPRPLHLVEQEDALFLVRERVAGRSLGEWVAGRRGEDGRVGVPWAEARPLALALVDLIDRARAQGLVLLDLSPDHLVVRPDGGVRLTALELTAEAGAPADPFAPIPVRPGVPGYRPPARIPRPTGPRPLHGCAEGLRHGADLYALGGLFFLLATGHDPLLGEGLPHAPPLLDRLGRWLALAARGGGTAAELGRLALDLRELSPDRRRSLAGIRAALTAGAPAPPTRRTPLPRTPGTPAATAVTGP